jgi:HK97 family phage major capsid protein
MYDPPCPHGYVNGSCAECRRAQSYGEHSEIVSPVGDSIEERFKRYLARHSDGQRAGWLTRRTEVTAELAKLEGYAHRSNAQDAQLDELTTELTVLGSLIDQDDVRVRSETIARGRELMKNPANCEGPAGSGGAPALVKDARHDRIETPAESIQRMRTDPWRDSGGPLDRETGAGLISRCHAALEGMEERLTRSGAQMLGNLLSERPSIYGPYEIRTREDVQRSAAWVLALSDPRYATAFEKILANPEVFRSGAGVLLWDDGERQAYSDVISRAALIENTGTGGSYWLPLYLDPTVILVNAGAASPWRKYCRTVQTTSSTWNGVASTGVTAQWLAEGTVSADATPTITQLQIPVFKQAAWVMASYELDSDQPNVAQSVPILIADAKQRLEEVSFVTGTGTAATGPAGVITRATVDGNVAVLTTASAPGVFSLLANLPVRFRTYPSANPFWAANILVINALRAITPFAAATASIVDDSTTPPKMLGLPFEESTTMDGVLTTGGHKGLLLMDGNSYLIVDRIGTQMIYEPLVPGTGGINPAGLAGWFAWSRVGGDVATATALRVHSTT